MGVEKTDQKIKIQRCEMNRSILTLRKQVEELKEQRNYTRRSAIACLMDSLVMEQKTEISDTELENTEDSNSGNNGGDDA